MATCRLAAWSAANNHSFVAKSVQFSAKKILCNSHNSCIHVIPDFEHTIRQKIVHNLLGKKTHNPGSPDTACNVYDLSPEHERWHCEVDESKQKGQLKVC